MVGFYHLGALWSWFISGCRVVCWPGLSLTEEYDVFGGIGSSTKCQVLLL